MSTLKALDPRRPAPDGPGIQPTWTSSAKDMVGCAIGPSRIWFTMGFGIVNEVYYPRVDIPQVRDLGFIVTDDQGFWVEIKRLNKYDVKLAAPGVPAVEVTHRHERFTLHLTVTPDPQRDVLIIDLNLEGDERLRPYVLLAPRLGASGWHNTASIQSLGGRRVLTAQQGPFSLALAAVDDAQGDGFGDASAGYVGTSDGWQDFDRNGTMQWRYTEAGPGNVALIAALQCQAVLGLGFGDSAQSAATLAVTSLLTPFQQVLHRQVEDWGNWQAETTAPVIAGLNAPEATRQQVMLSATVLSTSRDKTYPGTMVASLSVPWGNTKDDRAGYHLVWPRDLVESTGGLLALGAVEEARDSLRYLIASQVEDGHWYQNQWLGGTPHWTGVQLDETAAPVLLAAALDERDALGGIAVADMTERALGFIARNGPASDQDRWEENAGINCFTMAFCIAALVAGAKFVDPDSAETALALADFWNANLEDWTAVSDTPLARKLGVAGYYVRMAPASVTADERTLHRQLILRNRPADRAAVPADEEVSTDFLQLVRFGLRAPDDPLMRDSITVIDALLKSDTPNGPAWRRYNGDGYGEHDDGRGYDGTGRGRPWPLLTGERGIYELAAGRNAQPYLDAMIAMAGRAGLLPEQVWDAAPIEAARLVPGKPTGSAMPLAWAHSEFIKLATSHHLGHPSDRPEAVWQRYQGKRPQPGRAFWLPQAPISTIAAGMSLIIALPRPAILHWSGDDWQSTADTPTRPIGLGLHGVEIPSDRLDQTDGIVFTWRWQDNRAWAGQNVAVRRLGAPAGQNQH